MPNKLTPKYEELPQDIREVFESDEIGKSVRTIGANFGLHIDQTGRVYNAVNLVLTGELEPTLFVETIAKNAAITNQQAVDIAKAVNEKVFLTVRESLKKIHGVGKEAPTRQNAPLEKKKDVIQAIEAPESVPMRVRVIEPTPASSPAPAVATPKPEPVAPVAPPIEAVAPAPTPALVFPPAVEVAAAPTPIPAPAPTPVVAEVPPPQPPTPPAVPAAPKKPAPVAPPRPAGIDPYRETAA